VAPVSTLVDELKVEGLDAALAERLAAAGFPTAKSMFTATAEQLMQVEGVDQELSFRLIDAVQAHFGE
jgi:N utilization substance protein A